MSVAEWRKAPDCNPGSREFDSPHSLQRFVAQFVERTADNREVSGSIPLEATTIFMPP